MGMDQANSQRHPYMDAHKFLKVVQDYQNPILPTDARNEAFVRFYEHFFRFVYYIACRCLSKTTVAQLDLKDAALDVATDVFTSLWEKPIDGTKPEHEWRAWMCAIISNKAKTLGKREGSRIKREETYVKDRPEFASSGQYHNGQKIKTNYRLQDGDPLGEIIRNERHAAVQSAIDQLPDEIRELMQGHYYEGLKVAQLATNTKSPYGTIASRMSRGRAELQFILGSLEDIPETRKGSEPSTDLKVK